MREVGDAVTFRHLGSYLNGVVEEAWLAFGQSAYRLRLADGSTVCASEYAVELGVGK